ncbi:MAG: hypothetical protein HC857_10410 [Synechococcales cyanobacterium RU_4_20]|nr:hypothetical protein [Synechococcales cyanobacterium RU_4_20]NJR67756.1 hypothetical protein [Synechococcales cyanobacterium CRU_2_2]
MTPQQKTTQQTTQGSNQLNTEECIVQVTSDVDEGQECFVITTPAATYYYQKEGCGFSSLIDRSGNDWINYHPTGGSAGNYRGIPNMGLNVFGHPGYTTGAKSWLSEQRSHFVQITSESADGTWKVIWEFHPDRAVMTAQKIGASAWLLYEGTPGGKFLPSEQYWLSSDGKVRLCDRKFRGHLPNPKWVAFCDPQSSRSLVLSYKGESTQKDTYWPMGGEKGMTVFGFGRSDLLVRTKRHISETPFQFSFALVETLQYKVIKAAVETF